MSGRDFHPNYCLTAAVKAIAWADSLPVRVEAFMDIAGRRPLVMAVYRIHRYLHPGWLSSLMVACYGIKSYLALSLEDNRRPIIATYVFANEKRQIDFFAQCVGEGMVEPVRYGNRQLFTRRGLGLALGAAMHAGRLRRYLRLAHRLNRRLSFMPACRTLSAVGLYARFLNELRRTRPQAVVVAADYSPDGLALSWAARRLGIATILMCHSFPTPDIPRLRLRYSLSALYGEKMVRMYEKTGPVTGAVVLRDIEGLYRPMQAQALKPQGMTIGIFLSAPLNEAGLARTVAEAQMALNPGRIIIRKHPEILNSVNLGALAGPYPNLEVTFGTPMEHDLHRCDMVIIGNSSAVLQVLKYGVPCLYTPQLEHSPEDFMGFVRGRIVPTYGSAADLNAEAIRAFYTQEEWVRRFAEYDHRYGQPSIFPAELKEAVSALCAIKPVAK